MTTLDDLMAALDDLIAEHHPRATSVRLPEPLLRATAAAVDLGMDRSTTSALNAALEDRVRRFARGKALAAHFAEYPADIPSLADVVQRRAAGTDHAAATRPDLVALAVRSVERQRPDWATSGAVDSGVDLALSLVEMLTWMEPVHTGPKRPKSA